jgi:hypothetical protein
MFIVKYDNDDILTIFIIVKYYNKYDNKDDLTHNIIMRQIG